MKAREWIRHQASLLEGVILDETGIQVIVNVDYVEDETDYAVEKIFQLVEAMTGIERSRIRGNDRYKDVVNARLIILYLVHKYIRGLTHQKLTKYFKRDRSTITASLQHIKDLKEAHDAFFLIELKRVEQAFLNSKTEIHENANN